jgi:hypothetical protein
MPRSHSLTGVAEFNCSGSGKGLSLMTSTLLSFHFCKTSLMATTSNGDGGVRPSRSTQWAASVHFI